MQRHEIIVAVDKDKKRLNRVFDDLVVHKECVIDNYDDGWHVPMQDLGRIICKKPLTKEGFIDIWVKKNNQSNSISGKLIRLKPCVVVEKIDGNSMNIFKFKRRRIK